MLQILLVEDDEMVSDAVKSALEDVCQASVICASDGATAAMLLRSNDVDLAVIDLGLPDISGIELARRTANGNIPVLLMSGQVDQQPICDEFGVPFLAKPFRLAELAAAADAAMRQARTNIAAVKDSFKQLVATFNNSTRIYNDARRVRMESIAARELRHTKTEPEA